MYASNWKDNIIGVAAPEFPELLWCTCDVGTGHKYNIRIYYMPMFTLSNIPCMLCIRRIEEYVGTKIIIVLNCQLHAIQITAPMPCL